MKNSRIVFRFDDRDAYGRPISFVSFYERVQNRSLFVRFMRPQTDSYGFETDSYENRLLVIRDDFRVGILPPYLISLRLVNFRR